MNPQKTPFQERLIKRKYNSSFFLALLFILINLHDKKEIRQFYLNVCKEI